MYLAPQFNCLPLGQFLSKYKESLGNLVLYAKFGKNSQLMQSRSQKCFHELFMEKKNDIRKLGRIRSIAKWDEKKGSNITIISKTSFLLLSTIKEGHKKVDY